MTIKTYNEKERETANNVPIKDLDDLHEINGKQYFALLINDGKIVAIEIY